MPTHVVIALLTTIGMGLFGFGVMVPSYRFSINYLGGPEFVFTVILLVVTLIGCLLLWPISLRLGAAWTNDATASLRRLPFRLLFAYVLSVGTTYFIAEVFREIVTSEFGILVMLVSMILPWIGYAASGLITPRKSTWSALLLSNIIFAVLILAFPKLPLLCLVFVQCPVVSSGIMKDNRGFAGCKNASDSKTTVWRREMRSEVANCQCGQPNL
jgi:hypothetical protein